MAKKAFRTTRALRSVLMTACVLTALVCVWAALAQAGVRRSATAPNAPAGYSVTLEQCVTSTVQSERSATFTAQMVSNATTQKMTMRIELQQRVRGETEFHSIIAPGLGAWHSSEPGVKIYKYVKQVTNLTAPGAYRAVVRFRWIGDKGHVLKRAELHTQRCLQPTLSAHVKQAPAA